MTLDKKAFDGWGARLAAVAGRVAAESPGERPERQPVHTVYGGANLFRYDTAAKLGRLATATLDEFAPDADTLAEALGIADADLAGRVHARVAEKLGTEPVEDFRLDYEDGYGNRPDDEEDADADAGAGQLTAGMKAGTLPPFTGIRIKPLSGELHGRALRTLDIFVTTLAETNGALPPGFCVTLPKIQDPEQVAVLDEALSRLEDRLGLDPIALELMMETPQMVVDRDGRAGLRHYIAPAGDRIRGIHFGTYDYTASMSVTAAHQSMTHPACDFARHVMQVSAAGTGIWLSDGATNVMPVGDRDSVHAAWRLHFDHVRSSLVHGFYQGWDLHPAQLPSRYAAVYSFFMEGLDQAGERLSNFVDQAAKATLVGDVFDDAATGQGLLNYFLRAINCGAITEQEAIDRTSLTLAELHTRSFLRILEGRR
ncbi:aldolase/citrate lyase family protein [soil metagenome]